MPAVLLRYKTSIRCRPNGASCLLKIKRRIVLFRLGAVVSTTGLLLFLTCLHRRNSPLPSNELVSTSSADNDDPRRISTTTALQRLTLRGQNLSIDVQSLTILVWNTKNILWNRATDLRPSSRRRCVYTIDRRRYNDSAAVLFYGDLMHLSRFPVGARPPGQKWIYFSVETPINTVNTGIKQIRLQRQKDLYNVTSTYSMTSDVPLPYYSGICTAHQSVNDSHDVTTELYTVVRAKRHLAAWFVSHCETSSRREKYAEELGKHIQLDVYGRCGRLNCTRVSPNITDNYYTACDDMVVQQYKFYLAFENSLCRDYVTEKFFRFLPRDIVVVALGAADYARFVPADTFIDVRDFRSPAHLASRLLKLANDDELYVEYLRRKRRLHCIDRWSSENHETRLCRHLWNNVDVIERADMDIVDARRACVTARSFYHGVANRIRH